MTLIAKYKTHAINTIIAGVIGVFIGTFSDITSGLSAHFKKVNHSVQLDSAQNLILRKHDKLMIDVAQKVNSVDTKYEKCIQTDSVLIKSLEKVAEKLDNVVKSTGRVEGFLQHWNYSPTASTTAEINNDEILYLLNK